MASHDCYPGCVHCWCFVGGATGVIMSTDIYVIKFWRDWLKADELERIKLVNTLPIFKAKIINLPNKHNFGFVSASMLNDYFTDLEYAMAKQGDVRE